MNRWVKRSLYFPLSSPDNIIFFITLRCNGRCKHCFLSEVDNIKSNDISEKNILKITESLNRPAKIILTGGEPFLRSDLKSIIEGLMKNSYVRSIMLLTNGSFPDKIEDICREISSKYTKEFHLKISLDGLADTHNKIRRIPDGFNKAIETCERAKQIRCQYPQFLFSVNITLMKDNMHEVGRLVDYLEKKGYSSIVTLVRGNSFSTFNVPQDIIDPDYNPRENVKITIEEIKKVLQPIAKNHPSYFSPIYKRVLNITLNTLVSKKRQIPCYAGYKDAVIYSDASVSICEQVKPFGNLSKWDWDFLKAWNSKEAMDHRIKLLSCSCIHGCNIYTSVCSIYTFVRIRSNLMGAIQKLILAIKRKVKS